MKSVKSLNKLRCIMSLVFSFIIFLITTFGLVWGVSSDSLCIYAFTTWSNIICAVASMMSLPYAIDGLRKGHYHLPNWIIDVLYGGATGLSIVFLVIGISIFIPNFTLSTVYRSYLFIFHLVSPIVAISLFIFVNNDHYIKFKESLYALIPFAIYFILYFIQVIELGNWRDIYHMKSLLPIWLEFIILIIIAFGLSTGLRYLHNAIYKKNKKFEQNYYLKTSEFNMDNIEASIKKMANDNKASDKGNDYVVPRRLIKILKVKYQSTESVEALCNLYNKFYFADGIENK